MADSMTTEQKIAHFLKVAEDTGATQDERDTAAAQAERLMLKHNIDRATAQAADKNTDERIIKDDVFFGGAYGEARMQAAFQVASVFGLKAYKAEARDFDSNNSHKGREVNGFRLYLIGFESDLVDVMRLIRSLDVQSAVAQKEWAKDALFWVQDAAEKTRRKRTFALAFGIGAANRIKAERAEAVQEAGTGAALVLVSRAEKVAARWADMRSDLGIRKARAGRARRVDTNAYAAGREAGYNANTGGRQAISAQRAIGR